jgi:probable HAF family extracellular repeat protein
MKAKVNLSRTLVVLAVGLLVAVAVALSGVGLRTAETQTTPTYYKVQDLGTLGGSHSWASAINDSGQVVGYSYLAGDQNYHAFLYKDGKMTDLLTLGGTSSVAKGINKSGQVVGWSDNSSGQRHAFLYDSANGMKDLNDSIPADLGWTMYEAAGINTDGKIAASSYGNTQPDPIIVCDYWSGSGAPVGSALVLSPTTTAHYEVQDLGTLGGYYSRATSINDSSKVIGFSYTAPCGGEQAFFYDESADPKMQGVSMHEARGLNNSGKVVGYVKEFIDGMCVDVGSGNDCWRAVLYDSATKQKQYLGDLRGTYPFGWRGVFGSVANGINDSGDVVGMSGIQDGSYGGDVHAFLKESGQPMIDLNTLIPADSGWTIREATAINTDGQIAANGYKDGGGQHALLLTPTSDSPPPADTTAPTAKAPKHSFTTLSTLGTSTVPVKLTWSATDNPGGSGIASYQLQQSVNSGAYTTVELPSATATTISRSLAPGTTYRYRVTAKDKAGILSVWATGPSFKVTAFQESNPAIVDSGSWTTSQLSGAYGGSVQSASALGRNATFTVPSGSKNVEWVSYRGNRGKAQVWLDGVQQDANPTLTGIQPFDLYSSTAQVRKVVFSKAVSPTTSHKLEVRVLGQKNASSTSTRVDIDAFVRTN